MGTSLPRLSARLYLLFLIAAALLPVWLFAAYGLTRYALNERERFHGDALQVARQVALAVESELGSLLIVLTGLAKSVSLDAGDVAALRGDAARLVQGTDRIIILSDRDGRQLFNTGVPQGGLLPPATKLSEAEMIKFDAGLPLISNVYRSPVAAEFRVAVELPVRGPAGQKWLLAITVPTAHIRDVLMPAFPVGWTIGVGDQSGTYVARSQMHEEMTGKPGLPEYVQMIVGRSGTFTSRNFAGTTLLAGYYRSDFSDWFYTANIPLSTVQAPVWRSVQAISAIGLVAMIISGALAYFVGAGLTKAARELAASAAALGQGKPVPRVKTAISEFAVIGEALIGAERDLGEREKELEAVLETVPAAVWFTYDPKALQVIRNRFAAELMGLPTETSRSFGRPDQVIDTIAFQDGHPITRENRPLSRAMRGEKTDNEEFSYILPDSGIERTLLTSARPIRSAQGNIIGAVQVSLDISDRKRAEHHRKLLVKELNHRVKNTLAVVQALANQTLRNTTSLHDASQSLSSRLFSLAKAHDILTQENWSGADLGAVINATVASQIEADRVIQSGDPVWLAPSLAVALAMGFHELTTNALKYGALSTEEGIVSISWTNQKQGEDRHLRVIWRESGGPSVSLPHKKGFGTRMIKRILNSAAGEVTLTFEPSGIVCIFDAKVNFSAPPV